MTPKPCNLPPVADMTPAQIMAEAARILRNMGGPEYDAGYSWGLAERLVKMAMETEMDGSEEQAYMFECLGVRARNGIVAALAKNGVKITAAQITPQLAQSLTEVEILTIPNCGRKSLNEIKEWLFSLGYQSPFFRSVY